MPPVDRHAAISTIYNARNIRHILHRSASNKYKIRHVLVDRLQSAPPFESPLMTAINNLEYRIETSPAKVARRLCTELTAAATQADRRHAKFSPYLMEGPLPPEGIAHIGRLPEPVLYETARPGVGAASSQGRRPEMEDEHIAACFHARLRNEEETIWLQGVFDGHGAAQCAVFAKNNLVHYLRQSLERFDSADMATNVYNALKTGLVDLSRNFKGASGATANISLVIGDRLYVANVGDSRAILVGPDRTLALSEDAKPTAPKYMKSILARGGMVGNGRVNRTLALARALGDHYQNGSVSARPKVVSCPLPPAGARDGWYLLHVCDGITDVASSAQLGSFVRARAAQQTAPAQIAAELVATAYRSGSTDNLTALVVRLDTACQ